MKNVTVIFTCFNRKEKTITCIRTLTELNPNIRFQFIIVDDASTDGTVEAINSLKINTVIIKGSGSLYWCGGMRAGIAEYLKSDPPNNDYCLLVNDDVKFKDRSIEAMFDRLDDRNDVVVVGATCNEQGVFTYGLRCKEKWYKRNIIKSIEPSKTEIIGETCNANCILIPNVILKKVGNMDSAYTHSLGDYDFGFDITRHGYKLISSEDYVGYCSGNPVKGTWLDNHLSRKERLQKKESPKGNPAREWWHFLYKNYGVISAIGYSIIPYIKILIGK